MTKKWGFKRLKTALKFAKDNDKKLRYIILRGCQTLVIWLAISYIILGYIIVPVIVLGVIYYTYAVSNDEEVARMVQDIKNNGTMACPS
jgi:hypothetical protein